MSAIAWIVVWTSLLWLGPLWGITRGLWRRWRAARDRPDPAVCCDCRRNFGKFPGVATDFDLGRPLCAACRQYAIERAMALAEEAGRSKERFEMQFPGRLVGRVEHRAMSRHEDGKPAARMEKHE